VTLGRPEVTDVFVKGAERPGAAVAEASRPKTAFAATTSQPSPPNAAGSAPGSDAPLHAVPSRSSATAAPGGSPVNEADVLALAAGVEALSEHPLADAIVRAAAERGVARASVRNFESRTGRGAVAQTFDGRRVAVGNATLMRDLS